MWKSGKVWKYLKFGKINGSLEKIWKFWKYLEIIWKYGQLKIWKKKFGNNLEIWETFGMLHKFQKFGKFWNLEMKFENLEKNWNLEEM